MTGATGAMISMLDNVQFHQMSAVVNTQTKYITTLYTCDSNGYAGLCIKFLRKRVKLYGKVLNMENPLPFPKPF